MSWKYSGLSQSIALYRDSHKMDFSLSHYSTWIRLLKQFMVYSFNFFYLSPAPRHWPSRLSQVCRLPCRVFRAEQAQTQKRKQGRRSIRKGSESPEGRVQPSRGTKQQREVEGKDAALSSSGVESVHGLRRIIGWQELYCRLPSWY